MYRKPTDTGLLLHYHSHVDERYKRSLLNTMLNRAFKLSSTWKLFHQECERLKVTFSRLCYPEELVQSAIRQFIESKVSEDALPQQQELKKQDPKVRENKPPLVNQQCVVYNFQCNLCDAGYVGYTCRHLHQRIEEHNLRVLKEAHKNRYDTYSVRKVPCFATVMQLKQYFLQNCREEIFPATDTTFQIGYYADGNKKFSISSEIQLAEEFSLVKNGMITLWVDPHKDVPRGSLGKKRKGKKHNKPCFVRFVAPEVK